MGRTPDALGVACPACYAEPGHACTRLRLLKPTTTAGGFTTVQEPVRCHRARRDALAELRRRTRTIR